MATKECFSFFVCINDDVMKQWSQTESNLSSNTNHHYEIQ
jgi:hypothetical protein